MITNKDLSIDSENGKITLNGNKYDLGTQGEIDAAVKDVYSVMGQMGAKNLIPYPYYESSYTQNGITWTVNADGTVTANGTATANEQFLFNNQLKDVVKEGAKLILTGCPIGGTGSTYKMGVDKYTSAFSIVTNDFGEGGKFEMPTGASRVRVFAIIYTGTTVSNLTFKPMLRLASDTDETYQPYAMTNKQLTDQLATKQDTLTFDTAPTDESTNPVTSGGVFTALAGKTATPLTAGSGAAVDVNETYQIPADMLDRTLLTINVNRYARLGSVSVSIAAIKSGDCASGIKITPGSAANPSLDASVIITISTTGLITISAINNFDPCFIQLVAI